MLTAVTGDALKTSSSAKSVLSASNTLEVTSAALREEVEALLRQAVDY
jgi:hypothetical protein